MNSMRARVTRAESVESVVCARARDDAMSLVYISCNDVLLCRSDKSPTAAPTTSNTMKSPSASVNRARMVTFLNITTSTP
ncbi:hypothetical protein PIN31009_00001 [Pandoraea iniqua]|nr:hypothetical protein PIN31009_00001 [Pandoraea iniqua]